MKTIHTTDITSNSYHQTQEFKQNWSIESYCKKRGITRSKLEKHAFFSDVVELLAFDHVSEQMNDKDKSKWAHCWNWVYQKEFPLTEYHRRILKNITDGIEFRRSRLAYIRRRQSKKAAE